MKRRKRLLAAVLAAVLSMGMGISVSATEAPAGETGQPGDAGQPEQDGEGNPEELTEEEKLKQELDAVYAIPVQSNEWDGWPQGPGTYGEAAVVMDVETGAVLYAKNIDEHFYPASITKILTTLVALENGQLADPVLFTHDCVAFLEPGDSSIGMKEGNLITLEQALYATLLASANEAAYAVAENVGKNAGFDYNWFVEQMNAKCRELGGMNSNFTNTSGLPDPNHYTCARDMALIGREMFKYPEFFQIAQTYQYTIPASETTEEHIFQQHHKMLVEGDSNYYEYVIGGKTGYTQDALSTLVTMADNGSMQLVCVVLKTHGVNIYPDTKNLLEYAFANFGKASVAENETSEDVAEVLNTQDADARIILPNSVEFGDLEKEIIPDSEFAEEGIIEYRYGGNLLGSARVALSQSYLDARSADPGEEETPPETADSEAGAETGTKEKKGFLGVLDFLKDKTFTEKCILGGAGALLVILLIILTAVVSVGRKRKRKKRKTS